MVVGNITPLHQELAGFAQPIGNDPVNDSNFWSDRFVQNSFLGLSASEVKRLALRLLGAVGIMVSGGILASATLGVISAQASLIAIPCILGSVAVIYVSKQLSDFDPEVLERYRLLALNKNLDTVAAEYGWDNVIQWGILPPDVFSQKYRLQLQGKDLVSVINYYEMLTHQISQMRFVKSDYQIPKPSEWKHQWREETSGMTFQQILTAYSIEKLEIYNILENEELQCLKELKEAYVAVKREHDERVAIVERDFQSIITPFEQIYNTACALANQRYNENAIVQNHRSFDSRYSAERSAVQNQFNQRRDAVQAVFNQNVATIVKKGKVPEASQAQLNQFRQNFNSAVNQAQTEIRNLLSEIDTRYNLERSTLNTEESRLRTEREREMTEARQAYDLAIAEHLAEKENRLRPIEAAFRSSMGALDLSYRSRLRSMRASY